MNPKVSHMEPWQINSEVFPANVYLFPTIPGEEVREYMQKKYPGVDASDWCKFDGHAFSITRNDNGKKYFFLWLKRFRRTNARDVSFLAHEVSHLVHSICNYLGIMYAVENNNETFAYFMSHLMEQCYSHLAERTK